MAHRADTHRDTRTRRGLRLRTGIVAGALTATLGVAALTGAVTTASADSDSTPGSQVATTTADTSSTDSSSAAASSTDTSSTNAGATDTSTSSGNSSSASVSSGDTSATSHATSSGS